MFKNKNTIIGGALFALGFLNGSAYGSANDDKPQGIPSGEKASEIFPPEKIELRNIFENARTPKDLMPALKLIQGGLDYAFLFEGESENSDSDSLLHTAGDSFVLMVALFLLSTHSDLKDSFFEIINEGNDCGNTSLHTWCYYLFELDCPSDDDLASIKILLEAGVNPFAENNEGRTPRQALEEWVTEEEELSAEEKSYNSVEKLKMCKKGIGILKVAESAWLEEHPEDAKSGSEKEDEAKSEAKPEAEAGAEKVVDEEMKVSAIIDPEAEAAEAEAEAEE